MSESEEKSSRMRKSLQDKDLDAYRIDAHSLKSTMATIGLMELSERAKKNEFAARDKDEAFIASDAEDFIREYVEICDKLDKLAH